MEGTTRHFVDGDMTLWENLIIEATIDLIAPCLWHDRVELISCCALQLEKLFRNLVIARRVTTMGLKPCD
eukprot:9804754-Ditylum_brightwellii.AAC.1